MHLHLEAPSDNHQRLTPVELEQEIARLQRLVADLLVKNQQLRLELKVAHRVSRY